MIKNIFIAIFILAVPISAITGFTLNKRYVQGDTLKASTLTANLDSGSNWSSRLVDTLDKKYIRFTDLNNHDSTIRYLKVDTIRSNPNIDSISGSPYINAITTTTLTGNVTGNLSGNVTGSISGGTVSGSTGTFTSTVSADSVYSTKSLKSSRVWADSVFVNNTNVFASLEMPCSLYVENPTKQLIATGTAYASKAGKCVTITVPGLFGTFPASVTFCYLRLGNFASNYTAAQDNSAVIQLIENSSKILGIIVFGSPGNWVIYKSNGDFLTASGTSGIGQFGFSVSYTSYD